MEPTGISNSGSGGLTLGGNFLPGHQTHSPFSSSFANWLAAQKTSHPALAGDGASEWAAAAPAGAVDLQAGMRRCVLELDATATGWRINQDEIRFFARVIWQTASRGNCEACLALRPSELGLLQMHLSLSGQTLQLSLLVDEPNLVALLHAHRQELAEALANWGLTLGRFEVRSAPSEEASDAEQRAEGEPEPEQDASPERDPEDQKRAAPRRRPRQSFVEVVI